MKIKVRRYQNGDAKSLDEIYYNTIHNINAKDYTKEQLDVWAPSAYSVQEFNEWQKKLEKIRPFVATIDNTIVGFAELEPRGHIECFYVHHRYQSCGVGSALMLSIDKHAKKKSLNKISAEVSISAKLFFENKGFQVIKKHIEIMSGLELDYYLVEKYYLHK